MKNKIYFAALFFAISVYSQTDSLFLRLPDYIYTTTTSQYSVFYKNLILSETPDNYSFIVNCPVGYNDGNKYSLDSLTSGSYSIQIEVLDSLGNILETDESQLMVTENNITHNDTLKLLFIGDSLTKAGKYERYAKELLDEVGDYPIKLLGTQFYTTQDSIDGIFHEGRGGWKWANYTLDSLSPFVYSVYPGVDIQKYIDEKLNGEVPDIVMIFLGINDVFGIDASSLETIDATITNIFKDRSMGLLINEFAETLPNVPIGICLIPVANERQETWYTLYGDSTLCWEYRQCQHRLIQRYIDYYKDLAKPNFSMIPIYPNIDTFNGYYSTNALHPNLYGYEQIAYSVYSWIKYQISQLMTEPKNLQIGYNVNSIILSWDQSAGAYLYNIYRSTNPYSGFTPIGSTPDRFFIDSEINQSIRYFYKVTAENSLK